MTKPSTGPGELKGNPIVLIGIESLPGLSVALCNALKNAKIENVAQLASCKKLGTNDLSRNGRQIKNVGPKRIKELENTLIPLGVRWEMVEPTFVEGVQTEGDLRRMFEIPEDAAVPSYAEATNNFKPASVTTSNHSDANSLNVALRLPAIFSAAVEGDDSLRAQIERTLSEVANDLIGKDIPRQIEQVQAGEAWHSETAETLKKIKIGTEEGEDLEVLYRLPPLFAAACNADLTNRIATAFGHKAFEIIREHVKQRADQYAPSVQ